MTDDLSRLIPANDGLHTLVLPDDRRVIAKRRQDKPPGFFASGARGLQALRDASGSRASQVHGVGHDWILL